MHHVVISVADEPDGSVWLVWCETCKRWSEGFANRDQAVDLRMRHLIDPESDPVVAAVPEVPVTDR